MTSRQTVTQAVVDYTLGTSYEDIPEHIRKELHRCLTDGLAVMLSGSRAECSHIVHQYIRQSATYGGSPVIGTSLKTSATMAAMANGVAAHADDFDDTQLAETPDRVYGLLTHPTTPALAATLTAAHEVDASGREFLTAFAIAQEVECKLNEAVNPQHYLQGFHSTGTFGVFAATAGTARLYGLTPQQARFAFGIAASKSAGIRVNFGTMTKPYHAGAAAENGLVAAKLARLGYEADPNALDGQWGYFQVTGGGCDPSRVIGRLGNPYTLEWPGVSVKPYPCGSLNHPSMDTMLDLILEHDIGPEDVEEVRLGAGYNILNPLRYTDPQNELEAKFSLQFALGILLLRRKAGIREFTDEVVRSPEVRAAMQKVHTYHSPEIEARGAEKMRSLVEVRMKNGQVYSREATTSRGQPDRPMTREELAAKFTDCATGTLDAEGIAAALEAIGRVEHMERVDELVQRLVV